MSESNNWKNALEQQLRELHLPAFRECYEASAQRAAAESTGYGQYLSELAERECEARRQKRVERLLRQSRLPLEKDLESFDLKRLPAKLALQVKSLTDAGFVERKENILAFGQPGSGKTHALCAIGQEMIRTSEGRRKVYFSSSSLMVQELLLAKRDLKLKRLLKHLAGYDVLILDDLGYVQYDRDEMEVLFTLFAERYERGSVMITSNLPFSKWEQIFKDPMTTAAAIDRLVHHSVILELNVSSYRLEQAKNRKGSKKPVKGGG
jgi:DNA replication protein DnaC